MDEISKRIIEIEKEMAKPDFWQDKEKARAFIKELENLKQQKTSGSTSKYDKGDAVLTLMAGAGGDDAEDWAAILFRMYSKFAEKKKWPIKILHEHGGASGSLPAGRQGVKNITFEIQGKGVYGILKGEAGVHRLVRVSPFSAKKLRHTSFALLEIFPKFVEIGEIEIKEADLRIDFARSSGPGGQNVNKRETAVRLTHIPTNISVHVESERSQIQNKERALQLLRSKLYHYKQKEQAKEKEELRGGKRIEPEWGRQIRSYVFHPYKMVKDHRTGVETSDVDRVLGGGLEEFLEAEKNL